MRRLSSAEAGRTQLRAQGFGRPRPARVTARHLGAELARVGQFQIDSVNVCVRAHYMPAFARLGPYDTGLLDGLGPSRRAFEYWGHAASLLDVAVYPALRHRMADGRTWAGIERMGRDRPDLIERVFADVAASRVALTSRQVADDQVVDRTKWGWNWSDAKIALEWLFHRGRLAVATRNAQFERCYDLPARVIPAHVLAVPPMTAHESHVALVRRAAAALGVVTESDLATYFYLGRAPVAAAVKQLVSDGELEPVTVDGWGRPAYLVADTVVPRRITGRFLVAPFDSLVFDRDRLERTFGTTYRIEIYVPEVKRVHGYYVYLFWLAGRPAARVDLKADRAAGRLLVQSAWRDPGSTETSGRLAAELRAELESMAAWLGLGDIEVRPRGDLSEVLATTFSRLHAAADG